MTGKCHYHRRFFILRQRLSKWISKQCNLLMKNRNHFNLFIYLAIASTILCTVLFLTDININWKHSENWFIITPGVVESEQAFNSIVPTFFNFLAQDGWTPRFRVLSWTAFSLNLYFHRILYKIIPYHPSLSLTWIFSLLILPFIFYRVLRNLKIDVETAVLCVCLYYFTVGHLSCHLMFFHQAKPMSAFFFF